MRRFFYLLSGILIVLSLQSCALTLLDWVTPTSGYTLQADIAYGEHKRQRLDVYSPTQTTPKKQTLVFFYGGAWDSGNKDDYRFVAQAFAAQGYEVVIPDYRLYPEIKFPAFVNDAAASVKWVSQYTQNPIVLMGHSAGAHIAAMLALNNQFLNEVNFDRSRLAGWVGLSGPYDFLPFTSATVRDIFSAINTPEESQPIHYANQKGIPALLLHGEDDTRVLPKNSKNLAVALREFDTALTEKYYTDAGHAETVSGISVRLRDKSPSFDDILAFLSSLEESP